MDPFKDSAIFNPEEQARGLTREQIAALGLVDPVFFCRYFLPHLFSKPMPWIHRGILAILCKRTQFLWKYGELDKILRHFVWKEDWTDPNSPEHPIFAIEDGKIVMTLGRYTLLILPRGFSKTTIAGIAVPLRNICYQLVKFMVYVSEASNHAKMQVMNIRTELESRPDGQASNERLFNIFGHLAPDRQDPELWREDFIETRTGVAMIARGRGGQIRGLNHKGQRPQLIIPDDVEDEESVLTEEQRMKTRRWAYGSLMPALPELDPNASIVALGTLLHPEALLATWAKDPNWTVIKFGPIDRDGEAIWPENLSVAKLERMKRSATQAGTLSTFYLEYYGEIVPEDKVKFKRENFIYSPAEDIQHVAIYCDPAISEKRRADRAWVVAVGMSKKGRHFVLETWCKRGASPRDIVDQYFAMSIRWRATRHGVEATAYQAALIHLLREEMFRKKHYFEIEAVHHKTRKDTRILGILQPRFANSYIIFTKRFLDLEQELLEYGMPGVHDDGPDALAGAISLLDPFAAHAAGDNDLGEDQMPPLDEVLGEDWASWEGSFVGEVG